MAKQVYTDSQLKDALDSLLQGSSDPTDDGRHIYGYGNQSHTLSMLQTITATRILDYATYMASPEAPSKETLQSEAATFCSKYGPILDLKQVIQSQSPRMALAAEFKRASPSKGEIAPGLIAGDQAIIYANAGANIVSVLTEEHWFQGTLADMTEVRLATLKQRPAILRKDFVINEYMIAEAAANGADTILLIVAVLPRHLLCNLIAFARSVGMEPLVEVHAQEELKVALEAGARVIGVNNRNLHTFQMDLSTTERVANLLRQENKTFDHTNKVADYVICALSGMSTAFDVDRYRQAGVGMCLIGESLMRAADPSAAIAGLSLHPDDFTMNHSISVGGAYTQGTKLVKVCGITNGDDALVACRSGANLIGVIFAPNSKRCVSTDEAKQVVDVVRRFGERSARTSLAIPPANERALSNLVLRSRSLEEASRRPMVVGVFQNQDATFIRDMVQECGLDLVQLHGKEGMAAANIANTGAPTIRVVDIETEPVTGKASPTAVEDLLLSLTSDPVAILLDTSIKGAKEGGGTGVTFDWGICQNVQDAGLPVIIAGGLTPVNVHEAVLAVRPWGVDVSSGVEATPGKKDHAKVQAFCKCAREAAIEANKGF